MKSKNTSTSQAFSKLRVDAETLLNSGSVKGDNYESKDINAIFQELQVHQIELEMQNDELRIANEELEIHQIKFSSIYDLAPVGYFIMDRFGLITEVNAAGMRLIDATKAGVINRYLQAFVAPDHADKYYRFFKQLLSAPERQTCQVKFISNKGREFYAHLQGIAVNTLTGSSVQCYVAVIDITERIESEQRLAEIRDRLELSLEASKAGSWELDLTTMRLMLDHANYRLCHIDTHQFDGRYQSFIQLIHPHDRLMADEHFRNAFNNSSEIDMVCRFLGPHDKTSFISIRGHTISKPNQTKRFIGIMIDITEKRRIEEEAALLKATHQKNITTATLYAEENERRRISEALHDSVSQLLYSIKLQLNLLSVSQSPSAELINKTNELLQIAIQETRNISFELAPSILTDFGLPATIEELAKRLSLPMLLIKASVKGFSQRLDLLLEICIFRIVQELVNNCMKHSGASVITIEVKKTRNIDITVKDNGRGFDVNEANKKVPRGAGLQSIYNRLTLYNGEVNIHSAKGTGTTVTITLNP